MGRKKKAVEVEPTEIKAEVVKPLDDAEVLKIDHTHAGVSYKAGT